MTEIIFRIIELGVMVAVLIYVMAINKIRENEKASAMFDEVQGWADIVVRWAADRLNSEPGEQRRTAAIGALKEIRDKLGIQLTDEQVAMLVSSAYMMMSEDNIVIEKYETEESI